MGFSYTAESGPRSQESKGKAHLQKWEILLLIYNIFNSSQKKNVKKMCLSEFLRTTEILKSLVIGTLLQHLKQRGIVGNAIYGLDRAPPTNLQGRMLTCSMKERPPPTLLPLVRSVQAPYSFDIFLTRFLLRRYFLTNRPSLHLRNGLCLSR